MKFYSRIKTSFLSITSLITLKLPDIHSTNIAERFLKLKLILFSNFRAPIGLVYRFEMKNTGPNLNIGIQDTLNLL